MSRGVSSRMANQEDDQRLQKITLNKVPIPNKNIDCQSLLKEEISHQGWLRRKKPGILTDIFGTIVPAIMWERMFVVICKGCLYFYSSESDKKPQKAVSLFGYTRVMRASETLRKAGGVWPFKVAYVLDENDRVHYLSAPCEDDMMKWLKCIKLELYKANGVEYSEESIEDEDIHDLETPISTGNYFKRISDLKKIKEVVNDDSDMDDEYDYIEPPDEQTPRSNPQFSESSAAPSNAARNKVPNRNQPGKSPPPPTPAKPQSKACPPPTGYYPRFTLNQTTPPSTKPLPVPPVQKFVSTPKAPPPVMPKSKSPKGSEGGVGGVGRVSPAKTPSGESMPFISVADLSKALGSKAMLSGKSSSPVSKSPDHVAVSKSTSVAACKPLPPVPSQPRTSNAPTAIVAPMRQPAATRLNQYTQDLEGSALWTEDAGEGQKMLMNLGVEGAFMLRCCSDGSQALTLLAIADCQLRKYKIFRNEAGMYSLQTDFLPRFDSVHNLLNHYRSNSLPNRSTTLSHSYSELQGR